MHYDVVIIGAGPGGIFSAYELVKLAGTRTYRELVAAAGLNDPFEPEGLQAACAAAAKWLDGCDMTKIK